MEGVEAATAEVASDEIIYRRLADPGDNFITKDALTGAWQKPSSGAFKPDDDGVSVYRHVILESHGLGPADCVMTPTNVIVGMSTEDVRNVNIADSGQTTPLDVIPDPWPSDVQDPTHLRNSAHALIVGWDGLSKKQRLRGQRALARLDSLFWAHPEGEDETANL
jgi:hypothetical protein